MRWKNRRQSQNVEDRRGRGGAGSKLAVGGGLGGLLLALLVLFGGGDLGSFLGQAYTESSVRAASPAEEELSEFVATVLAETEDVWNRLLGPRYREPTLVLFDDQVQSACGYAGAAAGPFYCPPDENVYIDLAFCDELRTRFGAPGDFAQAYVIAHEVGHHVQNLLGTLEEVHARQRAAGDEEEANRLSVLLELQADFYAGVWAHHAERTALLEPGDIEEALNAASAIGDDRLQRRSQGYVVPESFTHGTSAQRTAWFRRGFESGDPRDGDTFSAAR